MADVIELFCTAQSEISILKEVVNAAAERWLEIRATEEFAFFYNTSLKKSPWKSTEDPAELGILDIHLSP